jgi:hypothetical protein
MAAGEHNPSRRALLGAAVALPFARHPGLDPGSSSAPAGRAARGTPDQVRGEEEAWHRALAGFEQAEAELRAFERRTAGAPWEEQDRVERGMDERLDALGPALRRLLRTPAPHPSEFAAKIVLAVDHNVWELTGWEMCLAALKRDAIRLAG